VIVMPCEAIQQSTMSASAAGVPPGWMAAFARNLPGVQGFAPPGALPRVRRKPAMGQIQMHVTVRPI